MQTMEGRGEREGFSELFDFGLPAVSRRMTAPEQEVPASDDSSEEVIMEGAARSQPSRAVVRLGEEQFKANPRRGTTGMLELMEMAQQEETEGSRPRSITSASVVAAGEGNEVFFIDAEGHECIVKVNNHRELDLYIDGRQKVQNLRNVSAEGETITFDGARILFRANAVKVGEEASQIADKILALKPSSLEERAAELLRRGEIRLLSVTWMLQRPSGYVLPCCQDLPYEAFIPPAKATQFLKKEGLIAALSYPWMSRRHPDPKGLHFKVFCQCLHRQLQYVRVLAKENHHWGFGDDDLGVFWDWASLPQKGPNGARTPAEEKIFKKGIGAMAFLYASPVTVVLMMTTMPPCDEEDVQDCDLNLRPYGQRGWCMFEATVSNIVKRGSFRLDLGLPAAKEALNKEGSSWTEVREAATAERMPLFEPEAMKRELELTVFTNGKEDQSAVVQKYEEFFHHAAATRKELNFTNCSNAAGWDDKAMAQLCAALPAFSHAADLSLAYHHGFSDAGLHSVLARLPLLRKLHTLTFFGCTGISGTCFQALAGHELPSLLELNLGNTGLTDLGLITFSNQMACFPALRKLVLSGCSGIGAIGVTALSKQLPKNLEELYFGRSAIDDKGLQALTKGLPALQHLCRLDFRGCASLREKGLAELIHCLPRLPKMVDVKSCSTCHAGHTLKEPAKYTFGFWACSRCREPAKLTDSLHVCTNMHSALYMSCDACRHGSLWVPKRLQSTPKGQALAQKWTQCGYEEEQLRWL